MSCLLSLSHNTQYSTVWLSCLLSLSLIILSHLIISDESHNLIHMILHLRAPLAASAPLSDRRGTTASHTRMLRVRTHTNRTRCRQRHHSHSHSHNHSHSHSHSHSRSHRRAGNVCKCCIFLLLAVSASASSPSDANVASPIASPFAFPTRPPPSSPVFAPPDGSVRFLQLRAQRLAASASESDAEAGSSQWRRSRGHSGGLNRLGLHRLGADRLDLNRLGLHRLGADAYGAAEAEESLSALRRLRRRFRFRRAAAAQHKPKSKDEDKSEWVNTAFVLLTLHCPHSHSPLQYT